MLSVNQFFIGNGDNRYSLLWEATSNTVAHPSRACQPVIFATLSLLRLLASQHFLCWRSRRLQPALTHPEHPRGHLTYSNWPRSLPLSAGPPGHPLTGTRSPAFPAVIVP